MTVPNFRHPFVERIQWITPDGIVYDLHEPPKKWVLYAEGWGFPPLRTETVSGPFQHGDSLLGVRLSPRRVTLIVRYMGCNRDEYWQLRGEFDNMMRPNRSFLDSTKPGTLRRILSTGEVRDLDCLLTTGPIYTPRQDGWDEFAFQETLEFTAFNPVIYDPVPVSQSIVDFTYDPGRVDLVFEFTFPFFFGGSEHIVSKSMTINYTGTWASYPTITIAGEGSRFRIRNVQTGHFIDIRYTIPPGTGIVIDLSYGRKTVKSTLGESLLGYVSTDSTLGLFAIETDPIAPLGVNALTFDVYDGGNNTTITVDYYTRFIAI